MLSAFNADELRLTLDMLPPSDALAAALSCTEFRDAIFARFAPRSPRLRTPVHTVTSVMQWQLSLGAPLAYALLSAARAGAPSFPMLFAQTTLHTLPAAADRHGIMKWPQDGMELAPEFIRDSVLWLYVFFTQLRRDVQPTATVTEMEGILIATTAARHGRLSVLEHLFSQGLPFMFADADGFVDTVTLASCAAIGGHLDVLKWLGDVGIFPGPTPNVGAFGDLNDTFTMVVVSAACGGHFEVLAWLRVLSDQITTAAWPRLIPLCMSAAALGGHLDLLADLFMQSPENCKRRWNAVEEDGAFGEFFENYDLHGVPESVLEMAAFGGHVAVMEWVKAHAAEPVWVQVRYSSCVAAANGQQLSVLQWLRSEGMQWNWDMQRQAVMLAGGDILAWALSDGMEPVQEFERQMYLTVGDTSDLFNALMELHLLHVGGATRARARNRYEARWVINPGPDPEEVGDDDAPWGYAQVQGAGSE